MHASLVQVTLSGTFLHGSKQVCEFFKEMFHDPCFAWSFPSVLCRAACILKLLQSRERCFSLRPQALGVFLWTLLPFRLWDSSIDRLHPQAWLQSVASQLLLHDVLWIHIKSWSVVSAGTQACQCPAYRLARPTGQSAVNVS